eukprot:augustus_masked-scaffold_8-processed-gene-5.56-mRNA-1 protein AED:1.00 eAED:1.00 QI:0/-1/0/0/-1/1/1/0/249
MEVSNMALTIGDIKGYLAFIQMGRTCSVTRSLDTHGLFETRGWVQVDSGWMEVSTMFDSGATFSCDCYDSYSRYFKVRSGDKTHSKLRTVELVNQDLRRTAEYVTVTLKIRVRLQKKAKEVYLKRVNIFLLRGNFSDLLVRRNILHSLGATPEQVILGSEIKAGMAFQANAIDHETDWQNLLNTELQRKVLREKLNEEVRDICARMSHEAWDGSKLVNIEKWMFKPIGDYSLRASHKHLNERFTLDLWI